jgi:hypothetical protein
VAGVRLFLIKRLSVYVDTKATRRHLLDTAVSLKKSDFNTPSVFLFLKKKNGGFDCISKPPLLYKARQCRQATVFICCKLSAIAYQKQLPKKKRADNHKKYSHRLSALRLSVWLFDN